MASLLVWKPQVALAGKLLSFLLGVPELRRGWLARVLGEGLLFSSGVTWV